MPSLPRPALSRRLLGACAGLALVALAASSILLAGCSGGDPPRQRAERRLLLVGWDGATWEVIDPMLRAGRLPNLARLMQRGVQAELLSTIVPISSAAWVGAATGRNPAQSGVYGFFEPIPGTYDVTLISARSSRATPIWRTLGRRGMRSVVVGVPVTYPPEPIAGVMVGGMLSPNDSVYTWPPGLVGRLRATGFVPDLGIWREANSISGPILEKQLAAKRQVVRDLLAGEDWDLAFVVYKELDVLSHFAYDGRSDGVVAALVQRLDEELGALLEQAGPDTNVLLVSDHGFHAFETSFFPHAWLLEQGFSVAAQGEPPSEAGDLNALPLAQRRALENGLQMRELDLERTRAFVGLSEGNFGGVRLNLAGREPRGGVEPQAADALLAEIEARLRELKVPGTERPLVLRTWRRAELYRGPHEDLIPDLLFETDLSVAVRPVSHDKAFESHDPPYPDHRREGIFVGAGPSLRAVAERGTAEIFDVGPTALHLLGQSLYEGLDGRPLVEWLQGLPEPRFAPESAETPLRAERKWLQDEGWSDPELEELKERLGQLGYVETR
jgi:predicted AlkP superfamily phosphohydrolase/phosphomutase